MSDDRPSRVYAIIVRDQRVFLEQRGLQHGLPGGVFREKAEDRKVELAEHLRRDLGIEAHAIWAQGAFFYRHPDESQEYFSGFYSVWEYDGEIAEDAGTWMSVDDIAASLLPTSIRILLTSVLSTRAVKTT